MKLAVVPLTLSQANEYIETYHRHHKRVQGHRYSLGAMLNGKLVGVVTVGRPVARNADDGETVEVTRLCSNGEKDVCSFLYGAAARVAKEMGFKKIITYTLEEEPGTSLRAVGWDLLGVSPGGSWSAPSRPRKDKHPLGPKKKWGRSLREVA